SHLLVVGGALAGELREVGSIGRRLRGWSRRRYRLRRRLRRSWRRARRLRRCERRKARQQRLQARDVIARQPVERGRRGTADQYRPAEQPRQEIRPASGPPTAAVRRGDEGIRSRLERTPVPRLQGPATEGIARRDGLEVTPVTVSGMLGRARMLSGTVVLGAVMPGGMILRAVVFGAVLRRRVCGCLR